MTATRTMGADPARGRRRRWGWWLATVICALGILFISSRPNLRSPVTFPLWDKLVHAGEYGLLGLLGLQAAAGSWPGYRHARRRVLGVCAAGLIMAVLDERLQASVPGRDASGADLAADAAGLAGAVLVEALRGRVARARDAKSRKAQR